MGSQAGGDTNQINSQLQPQRMSFEDFLLQAGVVSVASSSIENNNNPNVGVIDPNVALSQFVTHSPWMTHAQPYFQHPQENMMGTYVPNQTMVQPMHIGADTPFADGQVATASPVNVIGNTSGIKRGLSEDIVEKNEQRKLKRMIRNRESALRSRARKQVYLAELEIKVSHLEEENEKLRKEKDFVNKIANSPPPESKCHLRRVSSTSF